MEEDEVVPVVKTRKMNNVQMYIERELTVPSDNLEDRPITMKCLVPLRHQEVYNTADIKRVLKRFECEELADIAGRNAFDIISMRPVRTDPVEVKMSAVIG